MSPAAAAEFLSRSPARRAFFGARGGLAVGAAFSAWASVVYVLNPDTFAGPGRSLLTMVLIYLSGMPAAGVVLGLLAPIGRFKFGAALAGALGNLPIMAAVRIGQAGPVPWRSMDWLYVIFGAGAGFMAGLFVHENWIEKRRKKNSR